jgi:hypothetical protein
MAMVGVSFLLNLLRAREVDIKHAHMRTHSRAHTGPQRRTCQRVAGVRRSSSTDDKYSTRSSASRWQKGLVMWLRAISREVLLSSMACTQYFSTVRVSNVLA